MIGKEQRPPIYFDKYGMMTPRLKRIIARIRRKKAK